MENRVIVSVADGLHARSAAVFVKMAGDQPARVSIQKDGGAFADCTSILAVMNLGINEGDEVVLAAQGDGAEESISALTEYLTRR